MNTKLLDEQFAFLQNYFESIDIDDAILLEMIQMQLFRISSLNLNGYDATITHTNIKEVAWNFEGIKQVLSYYKPYCTNQNASKSYRDLKRKLSQTLTFLNKNLDYFSFPRLNFITGFINPINLLLVDFHKDIKLPWDPNKKPIHLETGFLFGKNDFNIRFFSIYYNDTLHLEQQAGLGKLLFYDTILSGNNKVSCATCHNPLLSFTDGLRKSITIDGLGNTDRNSPTLVNAIFQKSFFHDGRVFQLEQQIEEVIQNPIEMNSNFDIIIERLRKNTQYKFLFRNAFEGTRDSVITSYSIKKVLTEYEKTLISFDSRFDSYINGNKASLTQQEINGYNVFAGKALCGSCHFFPLFNGNVPPLFNDNEFEVIGVPENKDNKTIDSDLGRFRITHIKEHMGAFKTPSVRNIELTSPYMHNGVYETLEQVVDFYQKGGGVGLGFKIPNQTLPFDSLSLSNSEKTDLVMFLKTLTDTKVLQK